MKKLVSAICLVALLLSTLLLGGCGFFESDSGIMISSIEKTGTLADGSTEITVRFTDPAEAPLVFTIPAGKAGERGVGIKSITPTYDSNGMQTEIKIEFTDQAQAPVIFKITDGKTVNGVDTVWDENEQSYFLVFKQGDEVLASAKMPELSGIVGFTDSITNSDGSLTFAIKWGTSESVEEHEITIPAGNGISYMDAYTDSEGYHINVFYTNPSMGKEHNGKDSFLLPKPQDPNKWFAGTVEPTEGIRDGDFWFDERSQAIYIFKGDGWKPVIRFKDVVSKYHTLTFYANDGSEESDRVSYAEIDYMPHGECLSIVEISFPEPPEREGYKFVGWYADKDEDNPYYNPMFTNMTPVYTDLNLYAKWEALPATP